MQLTADPLEVERQVVLAYALEATLPKPACTSRYRDVGPKQRFEYFLVSAVNSGRYFHDLADRIRSVGGQPPVIYDLAYSALMTSQRSRAGKIVNYGLLEAMLPVVTAKCLYDRSGSDTLGLVCKVLEDTSKDDVRYLARMRREIYAHSDKEFKRRFRVTTGGKNVLEHYALHACRAHQASSLFVQELSGGMPLTRVMYEVVMKRGGSLKENIRMGFTRMRRASELPAGALADFTAAAIYLALSDDPEAAFVG